MRLPLLGVLAALLVALVTGSGTASAKGSAYLLTGGELGSYAYLLESFIPDADGTDWVASVEGMQVDPPPRPSSLAYDLYRRYGVFAIPSVLGPEIRYYPSLGLVQNLWSQQWYQPPAEAINYFDSTIQDALALMARGELEDDPFVADLRDRRMHEVNYFVLPYSLGSSHHTWARWARRLAGRVRCLPRSDPQRRGIRSRAPRRDGHHTRMPDSAMGPAYTIEFHGWFEGSGIGGFFGFYLPPAHGEAGRFWTSGYVHDEDAPYYETTPGFDAAIEAALAGPYARAPETSAIGTDDFGFRPTVVGATLLAALLGVGVVRGLGASSRLALRNL